MTDSKAEELKKQIDTSRNEKIEIEEMEKFLETPENIKKLGETLETDTPPNLYEEFKTAIGEVCQEITTKKFLFFNFKKNDIEPNQVRILLLYLEKFSPEINEVNNQNNNIEILENEINNLNENLSIISGQLKIIENRIKEIKEKNEKDSQELEKARNESPTENTDFIVKLETQIYGDLEELGKKEQEYDMTKKDYNKTEKEILNKKSNLFNKKYAEEKSILKTIREKDKVYYNVGMSIYNLKKKLAEENLKWEDIKISLPGDKAYTKNFKHEKKLGKNPFFLMLQEDKNRKAEEEVKESMKRMEKLIPLNQVEILRSEFLDIISREYEEDKKGIEEILMKDGELTDKEKETLYYFMDYYKDFSNTYETEKNLKDKYPRTMKAASKVYDEKRINAMGNRNDTAKERLIGFRNWYYKELKEYFSPDEIAGWENDYKNNSAEREKNKSNPTRNMFSGLLSSIEKDNKIDGKFYDNIAREIDKKLNHETFKFIDDFIENGIKDDENLIQNLQKLNKRNTEFGKNHPEIKEKFKNKIENYIKNITDKKLKNDTDSGLNKNEIGIFQLRANIRFGENLAIDGTKGTLTKREPISNGEITTLYIYRQILSSRIAKEKERKEQIRNINNLLECIQNLDARNHLFRKFLVDIFFPIKNNRYGQIIESTILEIYEDAKSGKPFSQILMTLINKYVAEEDEGRGKKIAPDSRQNKGENKTYSEKLEEYAKKETNELNKTKQGAERLEQERIDEERRKKMIEGAHTNINIIGENLNKILNIYENEAWEWNPTKHNQIIALFKTSINICYRLPNFKDLYNKNEILIGIVKLMHLFYTNEKIASIFGSEVAKIANNIRDESLKEYERYSNTIDLIDQIEAQEKGNKWGLTIPRSGFNLLNGGYELYNKQRYNKDSYDKWLKITIPGLNIINKNYSQENWIWIKNKDIDKIIELLEKANKGEIKLCINFHEDYKHDGKDSSTPLGIESFAIVEKKGDNYTLTYQGNPKKTEKINKPKINKVKNEAFGIFADKDFQKFTEIGNSLSNAITEIQETVRTGKENNSISEYTIQKILQDSKNLIDRKNSLKNLLNGLLSKMKQELGNATSGRYQGQSDKDLREAYNALNSVYNLIDGNAIDDLFNNLCDKNYLRANKGRWNQLCNRVDDNAIAIVAGIAAGIATVMTFGVAAPGALAVFALIINAGIMTAGGMVGSQIGNALNNGRRALSQKIFGTTTMTLSNGEVVERRQSATWSDMDRALGSSVSALFSGNNKESRENFSNYGSMFLEEWKEGTKTTAMFMGAGMILGRVFSAAAMKYPSFSGKLNKVGEVLNLKRLKFGDNYSEGLFNSMGKNAKNLTKSKQFWRETLEEVREEGSENIGEYIGDETSRGGIGCAITLYHSICPGGNTPEIYKNSKVTIDNVTNTDNEFILNIVCEAGNKKALIEHFKGQKFDFNDKDGTLHKRNEINPKFTNVIKITETNQNNFEERKTVSELISYGVQMNHGTGKVYYSNNKAIEKMRDDYAKSGEGVVTIDSETGTVTVNTIDQTITMEKSPSLIAQENLSSQHETWRAGRLNGNGTYEPLLTTTEDKTRIEQHHGDATVDIANTKFENLPQDVRIRAIMQARMQNIIEGVEEQKIEHNENLIVSPKRREEMVESMKNSEELTPEQQANIEKNKKILEDLGFEINDYETKFLKDLDLNEEQIDKLKKIQQEFKKLNFKVNVSEINTLLNLNPEEKNNVLNIIKANLGIDIEHIDDIKGIKLSDIEKENIKRITDLGIYVNSEFIEDIKDIILTDEEIAKFIKLRDELKIDITHAIYDIETIKKLNDEQINNIQNILKLGINVNIEAIEKIKNLKEDELNNFIKIRNLGINIEIKDIDIVKNLNPIQMNKIIEIKELFDIEVKDIKAIINLTEYEINNIKEIFNIFELDECSLLDISIEDINHIKNLTKTQINNFKEMHELGIDITKLEKFEETYIQKLDITEIERIKNLTPNEINNIKSTVKWLSPKFTYIRFSDIYILKDLNIKEKENIDNFMSKNLLKNFKINDLLIIKDIELTDNLISNIKILQSINIEVNAKDLDLVKDLNLTEDIINDLNEIQKFGISLEISNIKIIIENMNLIEIDSEISYDKYKYSEEEKSIHERYGRGTIIEKIQQYVQAANLENKNNISEAEILKEIRPLLIRLPINERVYFLTKISDIAKKFNTISSYLDFENGPYKEKYPTPKALLCAMRGITNPDIIEQISDNITVIRHGIGITFFIGDPNSYRIIYGGKLDTRDTGTGGFNTPYSEISDLNGTLSVINGENPGTNKNRRYRAIRHEGQHNRNTYFMTDKTENRPAIIRVKDEIIAYLRDGRGINEIEKILTTKENDGGIYQYDDVKTEQEWKTHKKQVNELLKCVNDLIILAEDSRTGLTKEKVISMLSDIPGKDWEILHSDLEEAIKLHTQRNINNEQIITLREKFVKHIKKWAGSNKFVSNIIEFWNSLFSDYSIDIKEFRWAGTATKETVLNELRNCKSIEEINDILNDPQYSHIGRGLDNKGGTEISAIIDDIIYGTLTINNIPDEIRPIVETVLEIGNNTKTENTRSTDSEKYFNGRSRKIFNVENAEGKAIENSKMMDEILNEINREGISQDEISSKLQELRKDISEQYKQATGEQLNLTNEQLLSILDAHEQDGILGELTLGQLRVKVKILSEAITDPKVRRFLLEAGFCGQEGINDNYKQDINELGKNLNLSKGDIENIEKSIELINKTPIQNGIRLGELPITEILNNNYEGIKDLVKFIPGPYQVLIFFRDYLALPNQKLGQLEYERNKKLQEILSNFSEDIKNKCKNAGIDIDEKLRILKGEISLEEAKQICTDEKIIKLAQNKEGIINKHALELAMKLSNWKIHTNEIGLIFELGNNEYTKIKELIKHLEKELSNANLSINNVGEIIQVGESHGKYRFEYLLKFYLIDGRRLTNHYKMGDIKHNLAISLMTNSLWDHYREYKGERRENLTNLIYQSAYAYMSKEEKQALGDYKKTGKGINKTANDPNNETSKIISQYFERMPLKEDIEVERKDPKFGIAGKIKLSMNGETKTLSEILDTGEKCDETNLEQSSFIRDSFISTTVHNYQTAPIVWHFTVKKGVGATYLDVLGLNSEGEVLLDKNCKITITKLEASNGGAKIYATVEKQNE